MDVEFYPSRAEGVFYAPPSKSMAHRYIICAALSRGESRIDNVVMSEDIKCTADCMRSFGAEITEDRSGLSVLGTRELRPAGPFRCGESGSTMRLIAPLCFMQEERCDLWAAPGLLNRPMDVYKKLCKENGIYFRRGKNRLYIEGKLRGGEYTVDASTSSQFVSGLLLALPLAERDSVLTLKSPVSKSYIDLTVQALRTFGIRLAREGDSFIIPAGQTYTAASCVCEGDYSNSALFFALTRIGGNAEIRGLSRDTLQGDAVCEKYLSVLSEGAEVLDITDCPDLAPLLFAYAALNRGGIFYGTGRLKYKESDRVQSMKTELERFGVKVETGKNRVLVFPAKLKKPSEPLDSHNDHRIVMALSLLLSVRGGVIKNAGCVSKSMPEFFEKLREVNIKTAVSGDNS